DGGNGQEEKNEDEGAINVERFLLFAQNERKNGDARRNLHERYRPSEPVEEVVGTKQRGPRPQWNRDVGARQRDRNDGEDRNDNEKITHFASTAPACGSRHPPPVSRRVDTLGIGRSRLSACQLPPRHS